MNSARLLLTVCGIAALCVGCHLFPPAPRPPAVGAATTRNNAYSLLHQLLSEDKDVSYLSLVKRENAPLKDLMKRIASTSAEGAGLLEELAKRDPSLRLDAVDLPSGEMATRRAIADFKQGQLLKDKRGDLELALLMSQAEALNYAWHLSLVASEVENRPDAHAALNKIRGDMENLYWQVWAMLLAKERPPARA
jgi:hypothetical protein